MAAHPRHGAIENGGEAVGGSKAGCSTSRNDKQSLELNDARHREKNNNQVLNDGGNSRQPFMEIIKRKIEAANITRFMKFVDERHHGSNRIC